MIVQELLEKTGAQALIYDPTYEDALDNLLLPKHRPCTDLSADAPEIVLPSIEVVDPSRIAFIFHTSGSTSGSPKLVPCSYRWIQAAITKTSQVHAPLHPDVQQDVSVYMGSACHIGQHCSKSPLPNSQWCGFSFIPSSFGPYGKCVVLDTTYQNRFFLRGACGYDCSLPVEPPLPICRIPFQSLAESAIGSQVIVDAG